MINKVKVLYFIPNTRWYNKRPWMQVPYTAGILTHLLKDEFDFNILDTNVLNLSFQESLDKIISLSPDIFLVSGLSVEYYQQYHKSFELAKNYNPKIKVVFGGIYPTLLPEKALEDKNIDYVFMGHAEERINDFINIISSSDLKEKISHFSGVGYRGIDGIVINPVKSFIGDIKKIAKPDYSFIDVSKYVSYKSQDVLNNTSEGSNATILTSFGCPQNCSFCASRTISGKKVLYRPMEDVLEEIDMYIHEYGVRNITFTDENLLAKRDRAEALLTHFINSKYDLKWQLANVALWHLDDSLLELMKKSGCTAISPSIESGSKRVLRDIIRKPIKIHDKVPGVVAKCKELEINIIAHFVIGMPGETWYEIRETFNYAESFEFDLVVFHIATPYPKTDLYKQCLEENLLPQDFDFFSDKFYGTSRGFITTDEFTPDELMVLRAYEWDRINFSTPQKTSLIANMMSMNLDELTQHRKNTRLKCGVHY